MKKVLLLVLLTASYSTFAQKKIIDHTTYDEWKSVSRTIVSHDGKYVSYEINPHKGDGYLYIYNVESGKLDSIPRGKRAKFAGDGSFIAFNIHPGQDTLRTCELKKIKKKKWPKDSLGIYVLATDSLIKMKELSSFKVDEESGWISIYQKHNNLPSTGKKKRKRRRRRKGPQYESDGKLLTILNPSTGDKKVYKNVTDYNVSEKGSWVAFTVHRREKSEKIDSVHIHTFNTKDQNEWCSKDQYNDVGSFSFDEQESRIVFLASNDTSEVKNYSLELLELSSGAITLLADSTQSFFPEGHGVSAFSDPWFTKDGSILYFGGKELARKDPKDTLIESEKVHLDIWHHMDKELQPMQLLQKKRDERKTDLYAWHLNKNTAIKLSNDTLDVAPEFDLRGKYLFGSSNELYAHTYNWVIPYPEDHYRVSIETGEVELIKSGVEFVGNLSPSGRYYTCLLYTSDAADE